MKATKWRLSQGHEARVTAGDPSAEQVKNPEHAAATAKPLAGGEAARTGIRNMNIKSETDRSYDLSVVTLEQRDPMRLLDSKEIAMVQHNWTMVDGHKVCDQDLTPNCPDAIWSDLERCQVETNIRCTNKAIKGGEMCRKHERMALEG